MKQRVEETLLAYLHPLTGGEDGTGWPFGGTIRYSQMMQRVFSVDGVDNVAIARADRRRRAQARVPRRSDRTDPPNALVYLARARDRRSTAREFEEQP